MDYSNKLRINLAFFHPGHLLSLVHLFADRDYLVTKRYRPLMNFILPFKKEIPSPIILRSDSLFATRLLNLWLRYQNPI